DAEICARMFSERGFWFAAKEIAKVDQAARFIEGGMGRVKTIGSRLGLRKAARAKLAPLGIGHTEDPAPFARTRGRPVFDQSGMDCFKFARVFSGEDERLGEDAAFLRVGAFPFWMTSGAIIPSRRMSVVPCRPPFG